MMLMHCSTPVNAPVLPVELDAPPGRQQELAKLVLSLQVSGWKSPFQRRLSDQPGEGKVSFLFPGPAALPSPHIVTFNDIHPNIFL